MQYSQLITIISFEMKMRYVLIIFCLFATFSANAFLDLKTRVTTHLSNPAAIAYSPQENCYYITNINGSPEFESNDGFITRLSIDERGVCMTEVVIKGGENGVTLNAPKGIVYNQGFIYVADINTIRIFSIDDSGNWKAIRSVPVKKSLFLNELALDRMGVLWVTDTSGNCVFELRPPYHKQVRRRFFYQQVVEPMGIALSDTSNELWITSLGNDKIYIADTKKRKITNRYHLRISGLAGISPFSKKRLVSTDFSSKAFLVTIEENKVSRKTINRTPLKKPAGVTYEPVSGLILVTEHNDNAVSIFMAPSPDTELVGESENMQVKEKSLGEKNENR